MWTVGGSREKEVYVDNLEKARGQNTVKMDFYGSLIFKDEYHSDTSILTHLVIIAAHYLSRCLVGNFESTTFLSLDIQTPLETYFKL